MTKKTWPTDKAARYQAELEHGWRVSCVATAQRVAWLAAQGPDGARAYLRDSYPHESYYVGRHSRLTRANIRTAIEALEVLYDGVPE